MQKKSTSEKIKSVAVSALIAINIALVGGVLGGVVMHNYDEGVNTKTAQAIQSALKTVPAAQADASPKANGR